MGGRHCDPGRDPTGGNRGPAAHATGHLWEAVHLVSRARQRNVSKVEETAGLGPVERHGHGRVRWLRHLAE